MLLSNIVLLKWTSVLLSFHVRAGGEERVGFVTWHTKQTQRLRASLLHQAGRLTSTCSAPADTALLAGGPLEQSMAWHLETALFHRTNVS